MYNSHTYPECLYESDHLPRMDPKSDLITYDYLNYCFRWGTSPPAEWEAEPDDRLSVEIAARILGVSLVELAIWKEHTDRDLDYMYNEADADAIHDWTADHLTW